MKNTKIKILSAILSFLCLFFSTNVIFALVPSVDGKINIISEQNSFLLFWDKIYKEDSSPIDEYEILMSDHSVRDGEYYDEFLRVRYSEDGVRVSSYGKNKFEQFKKYYFSIIAVDNGQKSEYYSDEVSGELGNSSDKIIPVNSGLIDEISTIDNVKENLNKDIADIDVQKTNQITNTGELLNNDSPNSVEFNLSNKQNEQSTGITTTTTTTTTTTNPETNLTNENENVNNNNNINDTGSVAVVQDLGSVSLTNNTGSDTILNNEISNQITPVTNSVNVTNTNSDLQNVWNKYYNVYGSESGYKSIISDENLKASAKEEVNQNKIVFVDDNNSNKQEVNFQEYSNKNILFITMGIIGGIVLFIIFVGVVFSFIKNRKLKSEINLIPNDDLVSINNNAETVVETNNNEVKNNEDLSNKISQIIDNDLKNDSENNSLMVSSELIMEESKDMISNVSKDNAENANQINTKENESCSLELNQSYNSSDQSIDLLPSSVEAIPGQAVESEICELSHVENKSFINRKKEVIKNCFDNMKSKLSILCFSVKERISLNIQKIKLIISNIKNFRSKTFQGGIV